MAKFTATFSTGETVTRNSEHPYRFAGCLRNVKTGRIIHVAFSKSAKPAVDRRVSEPSWYPGMCGAELREWKAKNSEYQKQWVVEIVPVSEVTA